MKFHEKLRRGRSHLLIVVLMIVTAIIVVSIEDENLTRETGKATPDHQAPLRAGAGEGAIPAQGREARSALPLSAPSGSDGDVVQLGAYLTRNQAQVGWEEIAKKARSAGIGVESIEVLIVQAHWDGRAVHRLLVRPEGESAAADLCSELKALDLECFTREVRP